MCKNFKLFFGCLFAVSMLGLVREHVVSVRAENVQQNLGFYDKYKIDEYRELFKKYCAVVYKVDLNNITDEDRFYVKNLYDGLMQFKEELRVVGVTPDKLDDYVHDKIEKDAGNFKVIDKKEFKNYYNAENKLILWQSVPKDIANDLKQGNFKIDLNYYSNLRGLNNYFGNEYRGEEQRRHCKGLTSDYGGASITTDFKEVWPDYNFKSFDMFDISKELEINLPRPLETLGFVADLDRLKLIDFPFLQRYICILRYEYPQEFGFLNEFMNFCSKKRVKKHLEGSKKGQCVHGLDMTYLFDYVNVERMKLQKEMIGFCENDLDFERDGGLGEKKKKLEELIRTDEYISKLNERLIKLNKKSHIVNENYYLLKNYALIAKILGFDAILRSCHGVCASEGEDRSNSSDKRHHKGLIVVNCNNLSICKEEFKNMNDCEGARV